MTTGETAIHHLRAGHGHLGIEFGSTRIKACLLGPDHTPLATGSHAWENDFVDGRWTYSMEDVVTGLQACYADLVSDVRTKYGVVPSSFDAIGVSAMMHGHIALDEQWNLLVPFRTWRNTSTGPAAAALTEALGFNIPQRWSVAHLLQAVLDKEEHVSRIAHLTTLAGHVHHLLTGRNVLGVGDASGMFPIDPATGTWDAAMLDRASGLVAEQAPGLDLADLLPEVLAAGAEAGTLTEEGAALLDPAGNLHPGVRLCPPEGDAGTGMVATNAVRPRTGNVSVGTSVFAMVVLEHPLTHVHEEIDVVTTPTGEPVAMVHCNNGASELDAWAQLFCRFAELAGAPSDSDSVFAALLGEAMKAEADAGGVLSFNTISGEPVAGLEEGRPLVVHAPGSRLTLANLMRSQLNSVFATLALGMRILSDEGVTIDRLMAHGGLLRTPGPAQRVLSAAVDAPVSVQRTAGEGGPWGMAVLASYLDHAEVPLADYLDEEVFASAAAETVHPDQTDVAGFARHLDQYAAALDLQRSASACLPPYPGNEK